MDAEADLSLHWTQIAEGTFWDVAVHLSESSQLAFK